MSDYFPEPKYSIGRVKAEWDLSNYAIETNLKNVWDVHTSKLARNVD